MGETKVCTKCGKELELNMFRKGRSSCKKCENLKSNQYRLNHKEYAKEYAKEYYKENRETICERSKKYYENSIDAVLEYREKNKEQLTEYRKNYYKENKECFAKHNKQYAIDNKQYFIEYKKQYNEDNKDIIKENAKQYYEKNKQYNDGSRKQYYVKNREHIIAHSKQYYMENKVHYVEYNKSYNANNKEYNAERAKRYRESHLKERCIYQQKREARKLSLPNTLTITQWESVKLHFNNTCCYCGKELPLAQEHFLALSKGGEYTVNNIIPSCGSCNSSKRDKDFFEWYPKYRYYSKKRETSILVYLNYKDDAQQMKIV